jgi:AcrR family transcriptional regulator
MPVAGRTRKDVVTEFREAEILQAARQVFAQRGFAEASMEEIAQAAGLAKGTLYLYYESKRDLYKAALHAGMAELADAVEAAVAAAPSLVASIEAYVATKVAYFDQHRDFVRIYLAEYGQAACGSGDPSYRDLSLRQNRLLQRVIRKSAQGDAARVQTAEQTAYAVADLTRGLIVRRVMGWSQAPKEKEIAFVVDFVKRALGC